MRILISIGFGATSILFGALKSVWSGFQYFSLCFICLLCFAWVVFFVQDYIYEYVTLYDEKFNIFFVRMINYENADIEIAKRNMPIYEKKFKKSLRREKFFEWFKICILYAVIGACLVTMVKFI